MSPEGDWHTWLVLAGRGFGKTRSGTEWLREKWQAGARRIAIVAETAADARDVLVEGPSGLLAISPRSERPIYEPSKRRVTWSNGAVATLYNGTEPDQLRGPQHDLALRQMSGGGTVITFELEAADGAAKQRAFEVLDRLKLIDISNNLGDAKTLITHPATTTHRAMGPEGRAAIGLGDGVVRISVGLEGTDDLIADLEQALS